MGPEAEARSAELGQASVELVAGIPAALLAAFLCLQILAAGFALTLADGAAEAGAAALASGRSAAPAARQALPAWARKSASVGIEGGRVTVRVHPPGPLAVVADQLPIDSSAWARRPG
jgi:hypothetical protein